MVIGVLREAEECETRVAFTPASIKKIKGWEGAPELLIEKDAGNFSGYSNEEYQQAGAKVVADRQEILQRASLFLQVNSPGRAVITKLPKGAIILAQFDPFRDHQTVKDLASGEITAVSMEMVPRTTRAQKMDVLSSQASLAGYAAVIKAADYSQKVCPMMMTPAGTISPSKIFVIGAGVAGLQAIATAKRLGASVTAFDTRAVVEEQVLSLGARFLKIDLGETGQTQQGYATALTEEQLAKQREGMARQCVQSDVVITTAKLFGKPAPRLITKEVVEKMRPGSLLVDLAVDTGGNIEGSSLNKVVDVGGVKIIGYANLERQVPFHASQVYSSNLETFLAEFWDREKGELSLSSEDEIVAGCVITRGGAVVNEQIEKALKG